MKKKLNFKNLFTGLKWQGGLFAAVSILAAIAIVIVVNLAVGLIPTSATRKDLSSEKALHRLRHQPQPSERSGRQCGDRRAGAH